MQSAQVEGSSSPLSLGSEKIFLVSATYSIGVDHSSYHRKNLAKKSCALAIAVCFALKVMKKVMPLTEKKKMVSYRQLGIVSSAFLGYENIIGDVEG